MMFSFNLAYMQVLPDTQNAPHHSPHPKSVGQPPCLNKRLTYIEGTNNYGMVFPLHKS